MSGPDRLSDTLQTAAGDLTRAVALPAYLFFLLPQPPCALCVALEVIDRREASVTDQLFAAKFATWLMLSGIVSADLREVPRRIAEGKRLAATALKLSPDDYEAMFLMEMLEALPPLKWDKALEAVGQGLLMRLRWGDIFFNKLVQNSPMFSDLFRTMPIVDERLNFIQALDHLQEDINKLRKDLKFAINLTHHKTGTEKELRLSELQFFGRLDSISSTLRVPASSTLRVPARFIEVFKEAGPAPPIHETDKAALVRQLRLLKRTRLCPLEWCRSCG
jgi:hypothetical protein